MYPIRQVSYEEFAGAARETKSETDEPYHFAYREFIRYFAQLTRITVHDFIISAHFTYGWMPTIVTLRNPSAYAEVAEILNAAKVGRIISSQDLLHLSVVVNNSLIGVSKLLHFIRPNKFAIWDSRVCKFIYGRSISESRDDEIKRYMAYLDNCDRLANHSDFYSVCIDICDKIGFEVSPFRAIEWVMYTQSK